MQVFEEGQSNACYFVELIIDSLITMSSKFLLPRFELKPSGV